MVVCMRCGAEVEGGVASCSVCGASLEIRVTPEPVKMGTRVPPVTPILSGLDPETGDEVVKVLSPGAKSEMRHRPDGSIELSVEGAEGIGRPGERRVMGTLLQKLREDGVTVSFEAGQDELGEDAKLRVESDLLTFQVVTAPSVNDFWHEASVGSATTSVDEGHAAGWLGTTVSKKARMMPPPQRAETVLAIDARHAAFLATEGVLDAYTAQFGEPSSDPGFSSVWVVGPITKYCSRIGQGTP